VPERARSQPEFRQCAKCGRVYWEGAHHARMTRLLEWATNRLKLLDQ